jgi:hypothetical protein
VLVSHKYDLDTTDVFQFLRATEAGQNVIIADLVWRATRLTKNVNQKAQPLRALW